MRVCAINGSLRGSRGVTHKILQHMCAGITSAGGSWNVIHLAELMIESCRACNHCQKTKTYKCVFDGQDDAEKVFTQMVDADVLIYASPVYLFGISSLLKRLLERIYSRAPIQGVLLTKSGLFFHATDPLLTRKPFVSVVVCDNMEDLTTRNIKDYFRIYGRFMDAPQVAHLERRSAAAWMVALGGADEQSKSQAENVVRAYEQAGHDLVSKGNISKDTKRATEQKFIKIPLIVRLARHVPMLRSALDAEIRKRSVVMIEND
jgi:multimeric flavodoxin WrbA